MLEPTQGGTAREVDVLITSTVGAHEFRIAIEASKTTRKADIEWVEQMIAKHADLPSDKLILYSGSGFTASAADKARRHNVGVVSLSDVPVGELDRSVLSELASADHAFVGITPERIAVSVVRGDASLMWFWADPRMPLYFDDGRQYELALIDCLAKLLDECFGEIGNLIRARRYQGTVEKTMWCEWNPLTVEVDGEPRQLYGLQTLARPPELHPIQRVGLAARLDVQIGTLLLTPGDLGGTRVAFGEVAAFGTPGVVVATEQEGQPRITVRLRDGRSADLHASPFADEGGANGPPGASGRVDVPP